jgi:hypothetical protein
MPDC